MKNLVVLSKSKAKLFESAVPWACISIADIKGEHPNLCKVKCQGILQLIFLDSESENDLMMSEIELLKKNESSMFTEEHAEQILDFVDGIWDKVETLMLHCYAGYSRSPAVAAALSKIYYNNDTHFFNSYSPNKMVYNTILKVAQERKENVSWATPIPGFY